MRRLRDLTTKEKIEYLAIFFLLPFAYIWHLFRKANFRTLSRRAVAVCLSAVMVITLLPTLSIPANAVEYGSGRTVNYKELTYGDIIYEGAILTNPGTSKCAIRTVTSKTVTTQTSSSGTPFASMVKSGGTWPADGNYFVVQYGVWGLDLYPIGNVYSVTFRYHSNGGNREDNFATWAFKSTDNFPDSHWNYANSGDSYYMTRTGYTATGYYAKADGSRSVHQDYEFTSYADLCSKYGVSTTANHTIDIYAQWTPNNYTVKFNANSGSGTMANQSFTWDTAQNLTSNAFTYTPKITFNENGGNAVSDASVAATFGGWEDRSTTTYGGTTYKYTDFDAPGYAARNSDVFNHVDFGNGFYNKYGLLNHYVNYGKAEYNDGSTSRAPNTGYIYGYPNGAKVSNLTTTAGGTVNLYAKWKYGKTTLPTPTRTGYTFKGWTGDLMDIATLTNGMEISDTTRGTIGSNASYAVTENLIPVVGGATYTSNYEVCGLYSFDANGNFIKRESDYATTHTVSSNAAFVRIEVNTTKGITFDQYQSGLTLTYTLPAGTSFPVGGNQTLTAQWQPSTYTVNFNANGGSVGTPSKTVTYDSTYGDLPEPTKIGYIFDGWYTNQNFETKVTRITEVQITENQTLYAKWRPNTYQANLYANGGSVSPTSIIVTYDSPYGTLPTPTRTGYTFNGWFTQSSGGDRVESTTVVKTASTHSLCAQWDANTYTVNFNANGGSVGTPSKTVTYDSTYGELPTPTRENHTFAGWFTAAEGGTQITSTTAVKITESQTLYARWNINTYTVT